MTARTKDTARTLALGLNKADLAQLLNSYRLQREEIDISHLQGHSHEHTLWESRAGQLKRFELLLALLGKTGVHNKAEQKSAVPEIGDSLAQASLLDVGCGIGDLYRYLSQGAMPVQYTGVDISPSFIEGCQLLYPEGAFYLRNILSESMPQQYDYVVASGVFTELITDNETYARSMIAEMYELARDGIAFNFLTLDRPTKIARTLKKWLATAPGIRHLWARLRARPVGEGAYSPNQLDDDDEGVYYFNIDKLLAFCETLGPGAQVSYATGYFSVDVTIYVSKPN